jgi:hypothetical protein
MDLWWARATDTVENTGFDRKVDRRDGRIAATGPVG